MVNREASVDMSTGQVMYLPPPPTKQAEVSRSSFKKANEYSQIVELNGLKDVGCLEFFDMKDIQHGRTIVDSKWLRRYKRVEFGNLLREKLEGGKRFHSSTRCRLPSGISDTRVSALKDHCSSYK